MKKVSINLLTNVILLLAGIILIIFHGVPNVLIWGSRVIGAMFLLPAVAYLIMVAVRHSDARTSADYMGVLPAVGGLCFGVVMMVKAHLFDEILQLLLGVLLVVLGLFHVIYLLLSRDTLKIKGWYHVCPVIVVLCGMLSLLLPSLRANVSTVVLITGICLLLFNFTSLQEYLAERRVRRAITQPADTQIKETNPFAVDDNMIDTDQ
jgi:peptidoglycan/LPS O-acetylase OafA/YrhL